MAVIAKQGVPFIQFADSRMDFPSYKLQGNVMCLKYKENVAILACNYNIYFDVRNILYMYLANLLTSRNMETISRLRLTLIVPLAASRRISGRLRLCEIRLEMLRFHNSNSSSSYAFSNIFKSFDLFNTIFELGL